MEKDVKGIKMVIRLKLLIRAKINEFHVVYKNTKNTNN